MTGKNGIFAKKALSVIIALILTFSGITVPGTGFQIAEVTEAEAATAKLSKSKKTLKVGKSFTLKVKNASKKYKFESSDPSVAKVKTKKGKKTKIIAVSAGKATITATLGDKVLKCVVTVKGKTVTAEPTAVPTPTQIPSYTASTDSYSEFSLPVGGKLQLNFGKEVRRYYVHDADAGYVSVTEDGLVTALKETSGPVTIQIETKSYDHYRCKINVTAGGHSSTTIEVTITTSTPDPTKTPTKVPTSAPDPTKIPLSVTEPTKIPTKTPTATPEPTKVPVVTTPTPVPTGQPATPYINPDKATLNVGDKLQLELVGAEALDFFLPFASDDEEFLEVTEAGLVTAKKPVSGITVICMDSSGKMYSCEIKVLAAGSNTEVDVNGIGSDGLGNKDHYDINTVPADITLGSSYGILVPHTREAYQKTMEFSIETEKDFVKACREALEHGAESFTIKFKMFDSDYWWNKFKERIQYYSDMSGYTADGFTGTADDHSITITPAYKDVWKAVTYLRYTGYEVDDDIKKLLNAAMMLTNDALAANPGDTKAALLYVNNRICEMTTYTDPIPKESDCPQRDATGVFFYGDGVCESYTAAMRLVLNILGLQNDTIVNKKGTHIWNRVMLDGIWYHIDVTWNDVEDTWHGGYYNTYFLLTEAELIQKSTQGKDENDPERLDHLWYNFYN